MPPGESQVMNAKAVDANAIEKEMKKLKAAEQAKQRCQHHGNSVAKLLDKIIPDPQARDRAKLELLKLEGDQEAATIAVQMQAIVAEAQSADPWTSRARPSFLYVMYALILWSLPMGVLEKKIDDWIATKKA